MSIPRILFLMWKTGGIPCLFHEFTGLYCPGCGGTRAAKALLSGHPLISFFYHPLILYCALTAICSLICYAVSLRTKGEKYYLFLEPKTVYLGVAVTVMNFAVKNFFLIIMGVDLLGKLPRV